MDRFRYWLGVVLVLTLPPGVLFWIVVHPFVGVWRRLGTAVTYVATFAFMFAVMALLWPLRSWLVGRDLGTSPWLIGAGAALYAVAIGIEIACRKHLSLRVLAGVPEIKEGTTSPLLTQGIYGCVRHPRYLGLYVGVTGWCLVSQHLGVYLVIAVTFGLLYVVIHLEERELLDRYGAEYADYRARVSRLLPRIGRRTGTDDR
jgi:protein-S-isoprenylcysteine O-methyltransferase Ste14